MSIELMSAVWRDEYYTKADKAKLLVALALADSANVDGFAFPSVDSIAKKARTSIRGVQEVCRELAADGKIEIQDGKGRNGTNLYRVLPPQPLHPTPAAIAPPTSKHREEGCSQFTPAKAAGCNEAALPPPVKAALPPPPQCTQSVRNHQEPSGNHQESLPLSDASRSRWFPEGMRDPAFVASFFKWEEHLQNAGKPLTPASRQAVLTKLRDVGTERARAIVEGSLAENYRTLVYDFDAKRNGNGSRPPRQTEAQRDQANTGLPRQEIRLKRL